MRLTVHQYQMMTGKRLSIYRLGSTNQMWSTIFLAMKLRRLDTCSQGEATCLSTSEQDMGLELQGFHYRRNPQIKVEVPEKQFLHLKKKKKKAMLYSLVAKVFSGIILLHVKICDLSPSDTEALQPMDGWWVRIRAERSIAISILIPTQSYF